MSMSLWQCHNGVRARGQVGPGRAWVPRIARAPKGALAEGARFWSGTTRRPMGVRAPRLLEPRAPAKNITPFLRSLCAGQALLFRSPDCREGSEVEEWKGTYTCGKA